MEFYCWRFCGFWKLFSRQYLVCYTWFSFLLYTFHSKLWVEWFNCLLCYFSVHVFCSSVSPGSVRSQNHRKCRKMSIYLLYSAQCLCTCTSRGGDFSHSMALDVSCSMPFWHSSCSCWWNFLNQAWVSTLWNVKDSTVVTVKEPSQLNSLSC